ncbi:MAG: alpha/beta hydrolase [Reichenbachiella sp.]
MVKVRRNDIKLEALHDWEKDGDYIIFGEFQHQLFVKQFGNSKARSAKTLLLIHGFPESSFSYHSVIEGLLETFDRIVLFDMIGYGFSEKPIKNYSYSLLKQADSAFAVWEHFGVKGGHILAHDMGNSVATEILARQNENSLPRSFSDGILSMTFTNGSIVLEMAKLRITQKILLTKLGPLLSKLTTFSLFNHQVRSAHGNENLTMENIQSLWQLNTLNNGHKKTYLTIKYLNDRKKFEKSRWIPAVQKTEIPVHFCWGKDDAVARVEMAHFLKNEVCPEATLTIMEDVGHFAQMDNPSKWIKSVTNFYKD